jgi:hypothetical protein
MWREECSYCKSDYSEVIKLQESNFTIQKRNWKFCLCYICWVRTNVLICPLAWEIMEIWQFFWGWPGFYHFFFSGLLWTHLNTMNTLNILCFCHPQLFLFSEQLLTGCCFPCNAMQFSAIAYHVYLVKQQHKIVGFPLLYSENSPIRLYVCSKMFKTWSFLFGYILCVLLL